MSIIATHCDYQLNYRYHILFCVFKRQVAIPTVHSNAVDVVVLPSLAYSSLVLIMDINLKDIAQFRLMKILVGSQDLFHLVGRTRYNRLLIVGV